MIVEAKEESYEITQLEEGVIGVNIAPGITLEEWSNLWVYQAPTGISYKFNLDDFFAIYAVRPGELVEGVYQPGEQIRKADLIRLQIADASKSGMRSILGPLQYIQASEFQNIDRLAFLDIGEPVLLFEGQWLLVQCQLTEGTVDAAASFFKLSCKRIRRSLF